MSRDYTKESSKVFGGIAKDYDKGRSGENVELWAEETRRLADLKGESIVLDLGCGTGLYSVGLLDESGATVCGMDPVPDMTAKALDKSHSINWLNGVGEWLPLRPRVLNCIFSSQVWHHIQDKQGTANECGRVLNEDGFVVIRTISHEQLRQKIVFKYFPEIMENQLRVYPSNSDFKNYFKNAGFKETTFIQYSIERYQTVEEFVEIAEKKLWSMFRPISQEGLERGIAELWRYKENHGDEPIRNDELITLVVSKK
jgi:ubiquinone/menaquinone biosynthesis C-methylase UbiE